MLDVLLRRFPALHLAHEKRQHWPENVLMPLVKHTKLQRKAGE